ncbi:NERD domain-containing protein [Nocardia pseudovaccinii]|uniref:NERD domain-containing protein n=1 Tax=Nocardia pseudovaccinii TaxID=189540 RepID=UPI000B311B92|nr:NERD domain-containing protein [Nocardia pseudovaccinii]
MYERRVPYREFSRAVRRFHRDRLLDKVAAASAAIQAGRVARARLPIRSPVQQFTLAAVARTALAESMVYRSDEPVTDQDLTRLCHLAIQVDHPDIPDHGILAAPVMRRLLGRLSYQQQLFVHAELEDITRTLALFDDHDPALTDMPTAAQWEQALGVPLPTYLTLAFTAFVGVGVHAGRFPHAAIAAAARVGAFGEGVDAHTATAVIDTHFAADRAELELTAKSGETALFAGGRQLWLSNPLLANPMVRRPDGYSAPIAPFVLHKITPLGMYFTGIGAFGDGFPKLVGESFEKLVGRHLRLLESQGAQVYPEVRYGHENKLTCDWLVVLPKLVLLVEAKGMRSIEPARLGDEDGLKTLASRVQKARNQIATTAKLIAGRIPELAHIPDDRPIRGLVVTLEPLHLVDTYVYEDLLEATAVETATASAHSVEEILPTVARLPDGQARLLDALTAKPPTPVALDRAVKGVVLERNPNSLKLWDNWRAATPVPID